jgi:pyruvate dehydrogenase E2 component (dihydrolipoamide acetyltransferase)
MSIEIKLPNLGENVKEAEVINIKVKEGDKVKKGDALIEIETDKATVEAPSEYDGIVEKILVQKGQKLKIGETFIILRELTDTHSEVSQVSSSSDYKLSTEKPVSNTTSIKETSSYTKVESAKSSHELENIVSIYLPKLEQNVQAVEIIKLHVKEGEFVKKDQILYEIETDKATIEVPSEYEGTVEEIFVKEREKVALDKVLMTLRLKTQDAQISSSKPQDKSSADSSFIGEEIPTTIKKEISAPKKETFIATQSFTIKIETDPTKIAPAAPTVRRFAREIGIDINQVKGTGPGGRITIADVKEYSKKLNEERAKVPVGYSTKTADLPDFSQFGKVEIQEMTNIRYKTAENMSFAWATIPHVTQHDKADITEIEKLRKMYSKTAEKAGGKLTITAILLKITASALKAFPQFNASVDMKNKSIIFKKYYNIGVAVDTERGLIVPVIKNVDKKNIIELSKELFDIAEKARNRKITPDDLQGGCFTITNLGSIGGSHFTPIVNWPEVAILGVSRANYELVYIDGKFEPRLMLPLSLSYDHRIIDGADGARFLKWIIDAIQQPFLLALEG